MAIDNATYRILVEVVDLIGEGQPWDALEIMRRKIDDDDLKYVVSVAQSKLPKPW